MHESQPLTAGLPCPRPGTNGFCIDLTNVPPGVPEHVLPRLPRTNGVINVPLFSDLRTHDMGPHLADIDLNGNPDNQPTDVAGLCITSRYFLTRVLWGVRDTGKLCEKQHRDTFVKRGPILICRRANGQHKTIDLLRHASIFFRHS